MAEEDDDGYLRTALPCRAMGDASNLAFDLQRHVWTIGDYPAVAQRLLPISEELVRRLDIGTGDTVLDVATGDGNAAILAARRGATVRGIDLTPAQIERAEARCAQIPVDIDFAVGNAEELDAEDFSYDVVMSVMGTIFAPDHRKAAAEMVRVAKPDGRVGLTAWAPGGFFELWRRQVQDFLPPAQPGMPDPEGWADPIAMRERFAAVGLELEVQVVPFEWEFATAVEAVEFFASTSGPFILALEAAAAAGQGDRARLRLISVIEEANERLAGGVRLSAPFTVGVGTR